MNNEKNIVGNKKEEKVLLMLLPMCSVLIPPAGISCLKSYLKKFDFNVKTIDANTEYEFKEIQESYLQTLIKILPESKKGNFYNMVNDVLENHMMAHINYIDKNQYVELIKCLVEKVFFYSLSDSQVSLLEEKVEMFFLRFKTYFLEVLRKEKPTVLGLSVFSTNAPASVYAFKLTKQMYPDIKTVMGGGIFTDQLVAGSKNLEYFVERNPFIDTFLVGEGEILFLKYLKGELDSNKKIFTQQDLGNEVIDINALDVPDFTDLNMEFYPQLAMFTSRSCPFQCSFCSETVLWGRYKKKNAEKVVKEMLDLSEKYKSQLFLMSDSLLNPIITDLSNELVKYEQSVYWDGYLRADLEVCNVENTLLWRKAGFYRARLGIESGSKHVLEMMGKKITTDQIRAAISSLAYAGIKTTTYWVVGYPGETEEDFQQTLDIIEELKDDIYEANCNPFYYYPKAQVKADYWDGKEEKALLYPEKFREMLLFDTWYLNSEPVREVVYERINRFMEHCKRLGVPNPYSLHDIYLADKRWKQNHKNSVPAMVEFMKTSENKGKYVSENKQVGIVNKVSTICEEDDLFNF